MQWLVDSKFATDWKDSANNRRLLSTDFKPVCGYRKMILLNGGKELEEELEEELELELELELEEVDRA